MNQLDRFWRNEQKKSALKAAEAAGQVADSLDVRMALVKRFESGEITFEVMQAELATIKRLAKRRGLTTRAAAFKAG